MGVCETAQEPDLCPPYYTPRPSPDGKEGDAPSPGDGSDPDNNGGSSGGGSGGWLPPIPGSWQKLPSGLWKLKKARRDCNAAAAPLSLKSSSSSSSDNNNINNNNDDDEHVVAVLAEPEKTPASTNTMQKGYTTNGEIEVDYASVAPSRAVKVQDSFLDVNSAAFMSGGGEDLVDITSR